MAEERTYIIPLRREFLKVAYYKKSRRAKDAVKKFIARHLRAKEVKIGIHLNEKIFENGRKNPPPKIKVKAIKEGDIARVELPEFPFETPKPEESKEKTKGAPKETKKEEEIKTEHKLEEKGKVKIKEPPITKQIEKHQREHKAESKEEIETKLKRKSMIPQSNKK